MNSPICSFETIRKYTKPLARKFPLIQQDTGNVQKRC